MTRPTSPPRSSRILHRSLAAGGMPPIAVGGEGIEIIDAEGRRYIDASGGAAVSCLGHGHPRVTAAIRAQLDRIAYAHTSFFTSDVAERLADELVAQAPPGIGHVYFTSGGSEALEAALKLARQYHVERGEPGRVRFVGRRQSYHGNTLGALAVGGNAARRRVFAPLLIEASHVSPAYAYRDQRPDETPEEYGRRLLAEIEATFAALDPGTIIAFVAETVGGATQGCATAPKGYFSGLRALCDRHGVLLILDEVMCGMGRTGTLHACEQEGIAPDILAIAKGLGAGYQPIGGLLIAAPVVEAISRGSGAFQHGHTYLAHPVACAAALAVQETIREENLLAAVRALGARLERRLAERFGNHHHVGDIRGRGLFQAIELVEDRADKAPFAQGRAMAAAVKRAAMARGLCVYTMAGTIDGVNGDHVMVAPPFIATDADIDRIVERLGEAVDAATGAG